MADTKTTALTENTAPLGTDLIYMIDDPGGSAASQKSTMTTLQGLMANGVAPGGRLTLTTATPVTTADVTAAATFYYTPYKNNYISLYDGTTWRLVSFTEKSLSLVGYTASKPYDIWGYISSGTLALESTVWTDATTRATALAYQDGRLVKSGAATRLYLGSIYVNSSGGQTDDSITKRNVFNYYNRVPRRFYKTEATQHNYSTTTWRSWNNDTAQRVEYMCGAIEDALTLEIFNSNAYTSAVGTVAYVGIGPDVTNNVDVTYPNYSVNAPYDSTKYSSSSHVMPVLGFHFLQVVQYGSTTTCTFKQFYLSGQIFA